MFGIFLQKRPGLLARPLSRVQISTMAVKENLLVAGGFQGELICKVHEFSNKCSFAPTKSVVVYSFHNLHLFGAAHETIWSCFLFEINNR